MAISKVEVRKCDRCGTVEEMRREGACYDWAKVRAQQVNGPFRIGTLCGSQHHDADLCPNCTSALQAWWKHVA